MEHIFIHIFWSPLYLTLFKRLIDYRVPIRFDNSVSGHLFIFGFGSYGIGVAVSSDSMLINCLDYCIVF